MLVSVMGIFKGDNGYRMNLLHLVNVTSSCISIRMWFYRLLSLLKEEGKTNCPVFCDMEGYILYAAAIESVFHPILEEIHIHRDRNFVDSIHGGLSVRQHYQCNCSFLRGAENQSLDNGVK